MILSCILDLGNILNGGTQKGQADGFNLDILKTINNMKDGNNKSVLVYITTKVKNIDETMENLKKKFFVNVTNATKITIPEVSAALMKLKKDLKEQSGLLKTISELKDKFYEVAAKKMAKCNEIIEQLDKDYTINTKMVEDIITAFGIDAKDPKAKNPEEFFKLIDEFMDQIDKFTPKTEPKRVNRKHEVGAKIK